MAHRLAQCGMRTISVFIDGLPETHDRLRGLRGGAHHSWNYDKNEPMICFKDVLF